MTTVRQIRPGEWELLRAVRLAALRDAPLAFTETLAEAEAMTAVFWQGRAERNAKGETSFCSLAFADDQPIGMAIGLLDQNDNALAYLVAMWVAPEYRGTEAAPLLIDAVASWAASRGAKVLFAGVLEGNMRAAAFYLKAGFARYDGMIPDHPATNGVELVLSKHLS